MKIKELMKDPTITAWIDELAAPEGTIRSYIQALRDYTAIVCKTPTELIAEAKAESRQGIPLGDTTLKLYLVKFRKYLYDKSLADTTVRTRMAGLKSFTLSMG